MCVNFALYPLLQTSFPLRKTEEGSEQIEKYLCQLRWSWFLRSPHALLKQMHSFDKIVFFHVAILYHFDLIDRSMHLYHNDLKLHLHYFCTVIPLGCVFCLIFTVKQWNFCVQKTRFIDSFTEDSVFRDRFQRFSDDLGEH